MDPRFHEDDREMNSKILELKKDLRLAGDAEKAIIYRRFFKTGKGGYGEGDKFLGVVVPEQRKIAFKYKNLTLKEIEVLIESPIHEERLTSLFILIDKFKKEKEENKKKIFDFYIKHLRRINNWDLVDSSAPYIVGEYLTDKDKTILMKLAYSKNLWERRVAILSTFTFIKKHKFEDTFNIARILLNDKEDLIHKAVGWMLREVGNRCGEEGEEEFLRKHYKTMPRTMLRYAIEKFSEQKRLKYLNKK